MVVTVVGFSSGGTGGRFAEHGGGRPLVADEPGDAALDTYFAVWVQLAAPATRSAAIAARKVRRNFDADIAITRPEARPLPSLRLRSLTCRGSGHASEAGDRQRQDHRPASWCPAGCARDVNTGSWGLSRPAAPRCSPGKPAWPPGHQLPGHRPTPGIGPDPAMSRIAHRYQHEEAAHARRAHPGRSGVIFPIAAGVL
jgi:hypothetical protein